MTGSGRSEPYDGEHLICPRCVQPSRDHHTEFFGVDGPRSIIECDCTEEPVAATMAECWEAEKRYERLQWMPFRVIK